MIYFYLLTLFPIVFSNQNCTIENQSLNCKVNFTIDISFVQLIKNMSNNVSIISLDFNYSKYSQSNIFYSQDTLWSKTLLIRNVKKFQLENDNLLFFSFFSNVKISNSIIDFWFENKPTTSFKICHVNNFRSKFTSFYSSNSLIFDSDNMYPNPICPYVFSHAKFFYFEIHNLNFKNKFRMLNVTNFMSIGTKVFRIVNSVIKWDTNILGYTLENSLISLEILNSTLYDFNLLRGQLIRSIVLNLLNMGEFFNNSKISWLYKLNFNYAIDLNDCYRITHNYKYSSKFVDLILNSSDYFYGDEDFCLFKNFPHQNLIFPVIISPTNLACTCTLTWLILNWKLRQILNTNESHYYNKMSMRTASMTDCFQNFDYHFKRCNFEQRLSDCGVSFNQSYHSKCKENVKYYRKGCVKKFVQLVFMVCLALVGSIVTLFVLISLALKPTKENIEILYLSELLFEFLSCMLLFFPSFIRVSDNYFGEIYNDLECELDFRSTSYKLNNLSAFLINFFIYVVITGANLSNVSFVIYSLISVFRPLNLKKILKIKISLPIFIIPVTLIAIIFNFDHFMVCYFSSCADKKIKGKQMKLVMLIKNGMVFILILVSFIMNVRLVRFLFIKAKQKKKLPITLKNYVEKYENMYLKPILKLIINNVLILMLIAVPHFLLSYYRIKSVTDFTEYPLDDNYFKYINSTYKIYLILSNLFFVLNIFQKILINFKLTYGVKNWLEYFK